MGARFCHWNIEVTNGRSHAIRLEEHAPLSAMVGVLGTTEPTNLYEAQLRARLRG